MTGFIGSAKDILGSALGKAMLGAILVGIILITFSMCSSAREEAAQSKQNERTADATTEAAKDAVATVVERAGDDANIDRIVTEAAKDIANAEGSDQPITPDARNAALRAACRLRAYAGDPACKVLRNDP